MNIKSLLGLKATTTVSPDHKAMTERIATAAGCQALIEELSQRNGADNSGRSASLLRRQLEELTRIQKGHAIEQDRQRAAEAVHRDTLAAAKALKAAEARLKSANDAVGQAGTVLAERVALVNRLNQELAQLHAAADKAVDIARSGFNDAVTAQDQTAEASAFAELRKAQQNRASCGDSLTARIKAHEAERERLERENATATGVASQAQDDVSLARLQLARAEYSQATQQMIDAFVKVRSLRALDSSGLAFSMTAIHNLDLTVANPEHVAWGGQLIGESGRLRDWVLVDMAKTLAPADLALLTAQAQEEIPADAPVAIPDPYSFTPGSVDYENALQVVHRAQVGPEAYEAGLRKEQAGKHRMGTTA